MPRNQNRRGTAMLRSLCLATILAVASLAPAQSTQAAEPEIYYFGATDCDFCANGLAYLKRLRQEDGRMRMHEYDIVASADDATTFVRVVSAIGLLDPQVPMTVIGHHVILGYQDDETTGNEIRLTLEQCRLASCPDFLHALVTYGTEVVSTTPKAKWVIARQFASASLKR
jgi:hypothetical protein